jgi:hypothetical protein
MSREADPEGGRKGKAANVVPWRDELLCVPSMPRQDPEDRRKNLDLDPPQYPSEWRAHWLDGTMDLPTSAISTPVSVG